MLESASGLTLRDSGTLCQVAGSGSEARAVTVTESGSGLQSLVPVPGPADSKCLTFIFQVSKLTVRGSVLQTRPVTDCKYATGIVMLSIGYCNRHALPA